MNPKRATGYDRDSSLGKVAFPGELISFAARKEAQAWELGAQFKAELPPVVWAAFAAARRGNWLEICRVWKELAQLSSDPNVPKPDPGLAAQIWNYLLEIRIAFDQFGLGEPKYAFAFGRGIIESIPPGSIYFGGTDPGRGLVTALCHAHETGDPFFTVTQNAFADRTYWQYLRAIYGAKISLLSEADRENAYDAYIQDAQFRQKNKQLKPGEQLGMVDGRAQINNAIAVMAINGLLTRLFFDRNPGREFFVEESFPLEWMYPHLAPQGLIMKIARQPLATLTPDQIERDREFWTERLDEMVGGWIRPETPLGDVCDFAKAIFLRKDFTRFTGDPSYVANEYARQAFSKLRSSLAGLYAWRVKSDSEPATKLRMAEAADFAFRQALALNPFSPEVVFRYVSFLLQEYRRADALLLAETACGLAPEINQFQHIAQTLRKMQTEA